MTSVSVCQVFNALLMLCHELLRSLLNAGRTSVVKVKKAKVASRNAQIIALVEFSLNVGRPTIKLNCYLTKS